MPKLDLALVSFGKLAGLMDASGTVQWVWFTNPLNGALLGIAKNRAELGPFFRALLDRDVASDPFDAASGLDWEPLKPTDSIGLGFVWNNNTAEPLHLSFGALTSFDIAAQKLAVGLRADLLSFNNNTPQATPEFGDVYLSAAFPVPQFFLNAGSLTGSFVDGNLALELKATNKTNASKSIKIPPLPPGFLVWDCARLAAFVVRSWVQVKAAENPADKGFFHRLDQHLFPMVGDPQPNPIAPLPPLDATGQAPNFSAWKDSLFGPGAGSTGALTFLWHLRALITGNESPSLLSGASSYFPVVTGGGAPPTFPPTSFPVAGSYPPSPDQTGVWVGIRPDPPAASRDLILEFRVGNPIVAHTVPIARFNNGTLERPTAPANFSAFKTALSAFLPAPSAGNGDQVTGEANPDGSYEIILVSKNVATGVGAVDGTYRFGFVLRDGEPIGYKFEGPILALTLPPPIAANELKDLAAELIADLLQWMLSTVLNTPGHPLTGPVQAFVNALIDFLKATIESGGAPSVDSIISAVAALGGAAAKFEAGPLSLDIAPNGELKPAIEIGPIDPKALKDLGITIGKIKAGASLALKTPGNPISGFSIGFLDVRLGQGGGGATGLVAQLLPDLREVDGFSIEVAWKVGDSFPDISGGGKIPIQRSLGPLEIVALLVEFQKDELTVGVDLFFQLGPITVIAYELGVKIPFNGGAPVPFLHGLGVAFDGGGIKLAGLFLEIPQGAGKPSDYVGGAVVSVVNLFELSAIGGYSQTAEGEASLFIFASLVAPLGGPPWFFITGIAGGFGYNRKLPSPELLWEHPFLLVMNGAITFDAGNPTGTIVKIAAEFAITPGQYWIAAGIQFTCFGFINGMVVVAVGFGQKFSFNLLGQLSYGIAPIAYFELAFMVTADEEHFLLKAGMSPNSYLIHPDIFSLRGDFAMGVWYAAPNAGDFVISIGGYHPLFTKPAHYPELSRVGCKAVVYNFIHVSVECFFACTPQALMAGASVSLWAEFEGIAAGLDVYVDVLIFWDPFHLRARLGVTVWFEFFGRHEIGVDLDVWTPPFGGKAVIDLELVSFTVSFGSDLPKQDPLKIHQFVTKQLGAPATQSGSGASVAALNTDEEAGLFRIDFTAGRTTEPQADSKKQEGLDAPVPLNSEFVFTIKTKLPIPEPGKGAEVNPRSVLECDDDLDLPLCDRLNLASKLTISGPEINKTKQTRLIDFFPAANFGEPLPAAQAKSTARDAISQIDTEHPSIPMSEGIEVRYEAEFDPVPGAYLTGANEEPPDPDQEYPLPLGGPQRRRLPITAALYDAAALKTHINPAIAHQPSRQLATALNAKIKIPPLEIKFAVADIYRVTAAIRTFTVTNPAEGVSVIDVPFSPARRPELFPVKLGIATARAVGFTKTAPAVRRAFFESERTDASTKVSAKEPTSVSVLPRKAAHIRLTGGSSVRSHRLGSDGHGFLRTIFLGGGEEVLGDTYSLAGQAHSTPPRTRQILLFHEGTEIPVGRESRENIGVESDTTLLSLGQRTFAAPGCVLQTGGALDFAPHLFDTAPGSTVLGELSHFEVFFPEIQKRATLILIVEPNAADPQSAREQVRWAASDARLSGLTTVVAPERTAFLMNVEAGRAWKLEIDLGPDWRIAGVIVAAASSRSLAQRFQQSSDWDLIDDRVAAGGRDQAINVTLEAMR